MDELAERCGIDPIEFRIMNGVKEGDRQTAGPPFKRIGFIETCRGDQEQPALPIANSKVPIAAAALPRDSGSTSACNQSATVNIHNDGTASVVTGSVDIGGSRAAHGDDSAEVWGIDVKDVRPLVADTDSIGHTDVTGGSRITLATGLAVYEAAQDVVRQFKERAAKLWEKKPEEVEFENGALSARAKASSR